MYSKIARRAVSRVGKLVRWTSSFLRLPKKLSMGALSRQFPRRLIEQRRPWRARIAWYGPLAYCLASTGRRNTCLR